MPRVTQYIRDEDFEAWKAIPNKSEFIHNALNGFMPKGMKPEMDIPPPVIKTKEDAVRVVKEVFPDAKPVTYKNTSNWGA